jgi:hypothetical protein
MPESRQGLLRLPEPLLRQLLCSEALDVEQVHTMAVLTLGSVTGTWR